MCEDAIDGIGKCIKQAGHMGAGEWHVAKREVDGWEEIWSWGESKDSRYMVTKIRQETLF